MRRAAFGRLRLPRTGAQYPAMTSRLVLESQRYGAHLQAASAALEPHTEVQLLDLIVAGDERIGRPGLAEPALFAVQYALARTLQEFGLAPCAVLGHGLGEFAAAAAGALPLGHAAPLVAGFGTVSCERFAALAARAPAGVPQTLFYSSARAAGCPASCWTAATGSSCAPVRSASSRRWPTCCCWRSGEVEIGRGRCSAP
ncbi:acyltransferase domain-containing protein [Catenulispora yoronensis]